MYGPLSNPLAVQDLIRDRQLEGELLAAHWKHRAGESQSAPRRHWIRETVGHLLAAASFGLRQPSTPWSTR